MTPSSLEITENEYCIKLDRNTFDLALIRQLIKRIKSEQLFATGVHLYDEEDIISKRSDRTADLDFDRLSDK